MSDIFVIILIVIIVLMVIVFAFIKVIGGAFSSITDLFKSDSESLSASTSILDPYFYTYNFVKPAGNFDLNRSYTESELTRLLQDNNRNSLFRGIAYNDTTKKYTPIYHVNFNEMVQSNSNDKIYIKRKRSDQSNAPLTRTFSIYYTYIPDRINKLKLLSDPKSSNTPPIFIMKYIFNALENVQKNGGSYDVQLGIMTKNIGASSIYLKSASDILKTASDNRSIPVRGFTSDGYFLFDMFTKRELELNDPDNSADHKVYMYIPADTKLDTTTYTKVSGAANILHNAVKGVKDESNAWEVDNMKFGNLLTKDGDSNVIYRLDSSRPVTKNDDYFIFRTKVEKINSSSTNKDDRIKDYARACASNPKCYGFSSYGFAYLDEMQSRDRLLSRDFSGGYNLNRYKNLNLGDSYYRNDKYTPFDYAEFENTDTNDANSTLSVDSKNNLQPSEYLDNCYIFDKQGTSINCTSSLVAQGTDKSTTKWNLKPMNPRKYNTNPNRKVIFDPSKVGLVKYN